MNVVEQIKHRIQEYPQGQPFSSRILLGLGTRAAVDKALSRLVESGEVKRVSRGVYVRPKFNKYVGAVVPEPIEVVRAKLEAENETLQVNGAEAARQFQFTTQVPTRNVFYTSGSSRKFRIGNLSVELKHVAPRKLILAGQPAGTALTALWYLGKENVSKAVIERIAETLPPKEFEALKSEKAAMPVWMAEQFRKYERVNAQA
jgi:hypothetical protein